MPDKRNDSKGRSLRSGESQLPDGRYKFQYTDSDGCRKAVYSWKLVETDRPKGSPATTGVSQGKGKRIQKDIDDRIKTQSVERTTVSNMFERFLQIRMYFRGTTRKCCRDLYNAHVGPVDGQQGDWRRKAVRHPELVKT